MLILLFEENKEKKKEKLKEKEEKGLIERPQKPWPIDPPEETDDDSNKGRLYKRDHKVFNKRDKHNKKKRVKRLGGIKDIDEHLKRKRIDKDGWTKIIKKSEKDEE